MSSRPLMIETPAHQKLDSYMSGGVQHLQAPVPNLNLSGGVFNRTQVSTDQVGSPEKSEDQQLMEISEEANFNSNMQPVTAAIKGLIDNSVMPKAVNPLKQVNVLLDIVNNDKDKVFIPLEIDSDPNNPGLIFKEARN